jgi:hypothetical protein
MGQPELQGNRHRVVLPQYGVIFEMKVKITKLQRVIRGLDPGRTQEAIDVQQF